MGYSLNRHKVITREVCHTFHFLRFLSLPFDFQQENYSAMDYDGRHAAQTLKIRGIMLPPQDRNSGSVYLVMGVTGRKHNAR